MFKSITDLIPKSISWITKLINWIVRLINTHKTISLLKDEKIILQDKIFLLQDANASLQKKNLKLEKEVAELENNKIKREKYYRHNIYNGYLVQATKATVDGVEQTIYACEHCFRNGKISILQPVLERSHILRCHTCNATVQFKQEEPETPATIEYEPVYE